VPSNLAKYYGAPKTGQVTGNKRLSGYYGDAGQGFTSARQIADEFAMNIEEYPTFFRRSFIAEKLRLRHDRELSLLSDALTVLRTRNLIVFDVNANQWKNLSRTS
jgi:hypothetical protein